MIACLVGVLRSIETFGERKKEVFGRFASQKNSLEYDFPNEILEVKM